MISAARLIFSKSFTGKNAKSLKLSWECTCVSLSLSACARRRACACMYNMLVLLDFLCTTVTCGVSVVLLCNVSQCTYYVEQRFFFHIWNTFKREKGKDADLARSLTLSFSVLVESFLLFLRLGIWSLPIDRAKFRNWQWRLWFLE